MPSGRRGPDDATDELFAAIHRNRDKFSVEAQIKTFHRIQARYDDGSVCYGTGRDVAGKLYPFDCKFWRRE